jgi:hypothetical protein
VFKQSFSTQVPEAVAAVTRDAEVRQSRGLVALLAALRSA